MDGNEFYIRKEDLLEKIADGIFQLKEAMLLLKILERQADEPDRIAIEELEQLQDHANDIEEWTSIEWDAVHPLAEAARQAAKK